MDPGYAFLIRDRCPRFGGGCRRATSPIPSTPLRPPEPATAPRVDRFAAVRGTSADAAGGERR